MIVTSVNEYIDGQFLAGGCGSRQTGRRWGRCSIYRHPSELQCAERFGQNMCVEYKE